MCYNYYRQMREVDMGKCSVCGKESYSRFLCRECVQKACSKEVEIKKEKDINAKS